jgi:tRNA (cmo5U34)-methyltransferase
MTDFADSEWSQREFAAGFVENADRYIVERRRMLGIVHSLYRHFVNPRCALRRARVLDLGSGDGALTHELLKIDGTIEATLIDASVDMLDAAQRRLLAFPHVRFIRRSFQELLRGADDLPAYDMVVSALAIHHLDSSEKKALFSVVLDHLENGGHFVNVDVVLARDASVEEWYMALWREWIREQTARCHSPQSFDYIPRQYKNNPDNVPSPLDEQLDMLITLGFNAVDCYYKFGIFAVFGGHK